MLELNNFSKLYNPRLYQWFTYIYIYLVINRNQYIFLTILNLF
jgi:hypothetical protein